ncbi:uncharacterized protein LOC116029641 [Ipomoea triloba]|uniref:uncharacterized protein LOC116029641 n=1 Tax=Ipomoea triloba TaxID=35885 RepID=UPI00125DD4F9|nr:uncharacterized protein LOC116029641 [Ipomoea triloba]
MPAAMEAGNLTSLQPRSYDVPCRREFANVPVGADDVSGRFGADDVSGGGCEDMRGGAELVQVNSAAPPPACSVDGGGVISSFPIRPSELTVSLRAKRVNCDDKCQLCLSGKESVLHLFVECDYAKACWSYLRLQCQAGSYTNFQDWMSTMSTSLSNTQACTLYIVCWKIWDLRNSILWNNQSLNAARFTVQSAQNYLNDWLEANKAGQFGDELAVAEEPKWSKPQLGLLKLNVDAAIDKPHSKMGFGCVLRNDQGHFVAARGSQWSGAYNSREAEAVAIRESLSWVKSHDFDNIIIETDSLQVVQGLNSTLE